MPLKLRISKSSSFLRWLRSPWRRAIVISLLTLCLAGGAVFTYYYLKYANMIQGKLDGGPFSDLSVLYAAPRPVSVGEDIESAEIAAYLRRAGYSEDSNRSRTGWYRLRRDGIEINPGPDAYDSEGGVIKIANGRVTEIISLHDHAPRTQFLLEPEPISNLFDKERQKRRIVRFDEIPKVMVNAVLSAEDKNFFLHAGFDPFGIIRAAYRDIVEGRMEGASTITQQLARTLWLGPDRGWKRKIPETLITLHLERKLSKEQIFEYYANSIYLGNQGSFSIHGFAQGAQVYFGKDLRQVTLPEAALLAGLPRSPGAYDPFRRKERAVGRRNTVLAAMLDNGYITRKEYEDAIATELKVNREAVETSDAPYFVDLVTDTMRTRFPALDPQTSSYRIYTTLDLQLQRDAVEAMRIGIKETDERWKRLNKKYGTADFPLAQAALIALDAETGEVKALVGGRSYGASQLDHAVAKRQPGSSFKPFVYAAAIATALDPASSKVLTPASTVVDEPTTFYFDETQPPYEPQNHGNHYDYGPVTLRDALARSLNIPAVKVAETVGYDKVAETAQAAGLNVNIKPTPSVALGAYEVTPLEIAGAYTVFVNKGDLLPPTFIKAIRQREGGTVFQAKLERKPALDPRVAYLVQNMMEQVLRSGTGAGTRSRGFLLPAAGKTGTSRDAWFAGFTSKLIAVVWVGFDDNRDFRLEGAQSALPIWTEFMNRAHAHYAYKNVHPFEPADGVVTMEIDADTGEIATSACPKIRTEVFIAGTQPLQACHLHNRGGATLISGWEPVQAPSVAAEEAPAAPQPRVARGKPSAKVIPIEKQAQAAEKPPESKRSMWDRIRGIFGR
jgi:penicillin-binding protein 1B